MKTKWSLYLGIIFLTVGIVLGRLTELEPEPIILIITGVLFKTYFIVSKIRTGDYIPGYEVGFLLVGLIMFLTGLYIRSHGGIINPAFLIFPGITLKVIFIILFIRKIRVRN